MPQNITPLLLILFYLNVPNITNIIFRYFDCRPNFGLFAPITKVSKSPSNRKPVACVVHSGPGIPPSGFRRANSKESLASNTSITSAASGVRRVRLGVTSLTTPQVG